MQLLKRDDYPEAYPNPFAESFIVEWDGQDLCIVTVTDMEGRIVYTGKMITGQQIPANDFAPGIYQVSIHSDIRDQQLRMVKTKQ